MANRFRIQLPEERVAGFCQRHRIRELALFGSVLREDFRPDSDVDVLVEFEPEAHHGLFALSRMQSELEEILGRGVDLIERSAIEKSRNYIRRKAILSSAETVYASR
ncbi:MAG TPA: nucleotidyltransferase domain-containing protein [Terriglobia bacterium]|nr:nucleotidyltransferase domain-containing protein [Terriglobia bacterium]